MIVFSFYEEHNSSNISLFCWKGMELETRNWLESYCSYWDSDGLKVEIETEGHLREMLAKYNQTDLVAKWKMNTEAEGEGRVWDNFQNSSALKNKNPHIFS